MKPGERAVFVLVALTVLAAIDVKLHELDMPIARFVRSFDSDLLNRVGDLVALPGHGGVVAGLFILIGFLGWQRQRLQLAPMTWSMAGVGDWVNHWWRQRNQLTDIGVRGIIAQLSITAASQLLKHLIGRPRPRFAHSDEFSMGPSLTGGFDSFPSGHAASAFGAAAVLAWFFPAVRVHLYLVAGLVSTARVLRGSHFPRDVLAGAILGVVLGSVAAVGLRRWPNDALPGLLRTGVPVVVSTFAILWIVLHPEPVWGPATRPGGGVRKDFTGGLARLDTIRIIICRLLAISVKTWSHKHESKTQRDKIQGKMPLGRRLAWSCVSAAGACRIPPPSPSPLRGGGRQGWGGIRAPVGGGSGVGA